MLTIVTEGKGISTHLALRDDGAVVSEQRKGCLNVGWDADAAKGINRTLHEERVKKSYVCRRAGHADAFKLQRA